MARTQKLKVTQITLDKEIYPRTAPSWQVSYQYSQSMLAGAKFPPIVVAKSDNKYILLDGLHRLNAKKVLKEDTIECEVLSNLNKKEMFEIAIQKNVAHGSTLTPFDKRNIALKLRAMKYPNIAIAKLIQVPQSKLNNFIAQRLVNSITGEVQGESFIVKSSLKHLAGTTVDESDKTNIQSTNSRLSIIDQLHLLKQLIELLQKDLIDRNDLEIEGCLKMIKKLI